MYYSDKVFGRSIFERTPPAVTAGLLLWLAAYAVIAVLGLFDYWDPTYPLTTGLLRLALAIAMSAVLAAAPGVLFWAIFLARGKRETAVNDGLRIARIVFVAAPIGFAALSIAARGADPWSTLPGGPSPRLKQFVRSHPHLRVKEYFGERRVQVRADTFEIFFSAGDLQDATLRFDHCDASRLRALGGPPPFPASVCRAMVWIERPAEAGPPEPDEEDFYVTYVFWVRSAATAKIREHFERWLRHAGVSAEFSGGADRKSARYSVDAQVGNLPLTIQIYTLPPLWTYIYVRIPKTALL